MKILVITNLFPNNQDPTRGMYNKQQIIELSKLCELKVIAPLPWAPPLKFNTKWYNHYKIAPKETIGGFEVIHTRYFMIPKFGRSLYGFFFFLSLFRKVKEIYESFKFDLIYSPWAYPDGFGSFLIAQKIGVPIIIGILGSDLNLFTRYALRRKMISYALKGSNRVIAVSRCLKQKAIELGVPSEKIEVITNGVDKNLFKQMDKMYCRKSLGLESDKKIILFIGHLVPVKGVDCLIDAFSCISKKCENSSLVIVGDGALKHEMLRKINTLGLKDRIKLISSTPHDKIPLWINSCDVLCLPSLNEGCPNVVLEALACGRPVVATNVGGIPDIIDTPDLGILVPPKNPEKLAAALETALNKHWDLKRANEKISSYSWSMNAEKLLEIIKVALHNAPGKNV